MIVSFCCINEWKVLSYLVSLKIYSNLWKVQKSYKNQESNISDIFDFSNDYICGMTIYFITITISVAGFKFLSCSFLNFVILSSVVCFFLSTYQLYFPFLEEKKSFLISINLMWWLKSLLLKKCSHVINLKF